MHVVHEARVRKQLEHSNHKNVHCMIAPHAPHLQFSQLACMHVLMSNGPSLLDEFSNVPLVDPIRMDNPGKDLFTYSVHLPIPHLIPMTPQIVILLKIIPLAVLQLKPQLVPLLQSPL